jgi:hypothetical protein
MKIQPVNCTMDEAVRAHSLTKFQKRGTKAAVIGGRVFVTKVINAGTKKRVLKLDGCFWSYDFNALAGDPLAADRIVLPAGHGTYPTWEPTGGAKIRRRGLTATADGAALMIPVAASRYEAGTAAVEGPFNWHVRGAPRVSWVRYTTGISTSNHFTPVTVYSHWVYTDGRPLAVSGASPIDSGSLVMLACCAVKCSDTKKYYTRVAQAQGDGGELHRRTGCGRGEHQWDQFTLYRPDHVFFRRHMEFLAGRAPCGVVP